MPKPINRGRAGIRLLLADDLVLMREGLKLLLASQSDFTVVAEAVDCREAVILAAEYRPDVILVNVRHPHLPTSEDVQALSLKGEIGVVFYSLYKNEFPLVRSVELAAGGFLEVNSSTADMFEAIRAAASGRRYIAASLERKGAFPDQNN